MDLPSCGKGGARSRVTPLGPKCSSTPPRAGQRGLGDRGPGQGSEASGATQPRAGGRRKGRSCSAARRGAGGVAARLPPRPRRTASLWSPAPPAARAQQPQQARAGSGRPEPSREGPRPPAAVWWGPPRAAGAVRARSPAGEGRPGRRRTAATENRSRRPSRPAAGAGTSRPRGRHFPGEAPLGQVEAQARANQRQTAAVCGVLIG